MYLFFTAFVVGLLIPIFYYYIKGVYKSKQQMSPELEKSVSALKRMIQQSEDKELTEEQQIVLDAAKQYVKEIDA